MRTMKSANRVTKRRPHEETTEAAEFLTIGDLAKMLRVSQSSIFQWLRNGTMPPGLHFGRSLRWRRQTIEAWIADKEAQVNGRN